MGLEFDSRLNRSIRKEHWEDLAVGTYGKISDAIQDENKDEAATLISYFHEEALVCRRIFDQWFLDTQRFLKSKGVSEPDVLDLIARIMATISPTPQIPWDREVGWLKYVSQKDTLCVRVRNVEFDAADKNELLQALFEVKEAWRLSHDLDVDLLLGLFDVVIDHFGEETIGDLWENHLIREWFNERYARFDVSKHDWKDSFELLTLLSFEAMHGHLCGPRRDGDVEFREYDDRVELEFDPCGSGGRAYRGEPLDGTGPRMEPPYGFKPIKGAYDFTWNKQGICTYCAHCCVLTEKLPAQTFGYPVRIVDPPSYPNEANAKCRYTIYKNLRNIPAHVYERIGLRKPSADRPLGSAAGPFTGS